MPFTIAEKKKALREEIAQTITRCTPAQLRESDKALFAAFLKLPQVQKPARFLHFWVLQGVSRRRWSCFCN